MACTSCQKKAAARKAASQKNAKASLKKVTVKGKDGKVLRLLK